MKNQFVRGCETGGVVGTRKRMLQWSFYRNNEMTGFFEQHKSVENKWWRLYWLSSAWYTSVTSWVPDHSGQWPELCAHHGHTAHRRGPSSSRLGHCEKAGLAAVVRDPHQKIVNCSIFQSWEHIYTNMGEERVKKEKRSRSRSKDRDRERRDRSRSRDRDRERRRWVLTWDTNIGLGRIWDFIYFMW